MKQLIDRAWLPVAGSISSISFKGIEEISKADFSLVQTPTVLSSEKSLFYYFLVGVMGALGGLALRLLWVQLKKWFPKLKKMEKDD